MAFYIREVFLYIMFCVKYMYRTYLRFSLLSIFSKTLSAKIKHLQIKDLCTEIGLSILLYAKKSFRLKLRKKLNFYAPGLKGFQWFPRGFHSGIWAVSAFHGMETTGKLGVAGMETRGKPRVNPGFPAGFR